jgi:glyoxylase-like metal-dependent hydrolase (beta-lactamase superfamily II)
VNYRVDVLKVGEFPETPGAEIYWMSNWGDDQWEPLAVYALLIRGGSQTVLVNSGPPLPELADLNEAWGAGSNGRHQLVVREEDHIENRLAALGVEPEAVDHLILTPLQPYATGGVEKFPNAQIHVNRYGWAELFAPRYKQHWHDVLHRCIVPRLIPYFFVDAWDRLNMLPNEYQLMPGIDIFWVGLHHRSSIAVKVQTSEGVVIFSDCMFRYEHITEHWLLGINENMYEAQEAYTRIRREADILVPMYDLRVLDDHPGGRIGELSD